MHRLNTTQKGFRMIKKKVNCIISIWHVSLLRPAKQFQKLAWIFINRQKSNWKEHNRDVQWPSSNSGCSFYWQKRRQMINLIRPSSCYSKDVVGRDDFGRIPRILFRYPANDATNPNECYLFSNRSMESFDLVSSARFQLMNNQFGIRSRIQREIWICKRASF